MSERLEGRATTASEGVSSSQAVTEPACSNRAPWRNLRDFGSPEHLFAGFLGLLFLILLTRALTIKANGNPGVWLPLLAYQDVLLWAGLAWSFYGLFRLTNSAWARSALAASGWLLVLLLTGLRMEYLLVDLAVCHPLTYHMMVLSGVAVQASFEQELRFARPMVPLAVASVIVIAEIIWLAAPNAARTLYRGFHTGPGVLLVVIYVVMGHFWEVEHPRDATLAANPEYVLVSSFLEPEIPAVAEAIPPAYFSDFMPGNRPGGSPFVGVLVSGRRTHPLNVVMVVMESVGAKHLGLYNSAEDTTPQLISLARHGMVFERIYDGQPETSSAMPALVCSIYPSHSLLSIPRKTPRIAIPGLPAILASHGYRTAFIHSGELIYDRQKDFLQAHGFAEIMDEPRDYDYPRDSELVPAAVKWIAGGRDRPFFLTIWTQDTHHPYLASPQGNQGGAPPVARYEDAIRSTDALIGRIANALAEMKLADNTLLIITGDHGEAFREHRQLIHGFSVYNEEIHIPLMIVNLKLIPHEMPINEVGRQIDIAPTLLGLLGYAVPESWQGTSLLGQRRNDRAYLFSIGGNFTMGVVDGDFKYIYDFTARRPQLYNLVADPGEANDLSSDPAHSALMERDHLRLEAWLVFQNRYLAQFSNADRKRENTSGS